MSSVSSAQSLTGLDWNGTGTVKRGIYWLNPPAMYPMTVLMKKYPRPIPVSERRYATDIFWGNHGTFQYGSNYCNAYWGFHQYPRPNGAPQGNGHWEVAVGTNYGTCSDVTARDNGSDPEISWNTWHSQAFVVQQVGNQWSHKLYVALPNTATANTISVTRFSAPSVPPRPSIMVGQTGRNDSNPNLSWGGEPRWEETNGVLRGFQFYTAALSQAQILRREACDTDSCVLQVCASDPPCPWYLNMNPTPSDVTDKSGNGHHATWDGADRSALWTGGGAAAPAAPVISSVSATNVTSSGATINWITDKSSDSQVEYGATTSYGQATTVNTPLVTSHSMSLSSLASGTTYHYRVRSKDSSGNSAVSSDFTFTTSSTADTTPPSISAVSATSVTSSGASIRWTTNEASDSQVDYGTTTSYGQATTIDSARVTSHSMNLGSLSAGTLYHYRVRSRDAAGNVATSADFTFTTTAAGGDTTPPVISAIGTSSVTASGATVRWTTNESADSQVDYGTTTGYGQTTTLDTARVTSHTVNLSGLNPSTLYHYRVRSRDAAGNLATSGDATFTTAAAGAGGGAPRASYGFTEAQGTSTVDGSGNGFHGSLVNGPQWTSGHGGNAVLFDGTNDKITLPSSLDIATLPFTLETWIRPTSRADYRAIFSKRAAYSATQMRVDIGLYTSSGRVYVTTQRSMPIFSYAPPLNTWTHIAVVAESSGTKLYVNGVLNQTLGAILRGTQASAPVTIGGTGDNDDPFAGTIDDLRLYNRALTQSEIQTDMATSLP